MQKRLDGQLVTSTTAVKFKVQTLALSSRERFQRSGRFTSTHLNSQAVEGDCNNQWHSCKKNDVVHLSMWKLQKHYMQKLYDDKDSGEDSDLNSSDITEIFVLDVICYFFIIFNKVP